MLQALELFGFKSFADKTRFEFPPGITVIVGPNGSGKSNVVDAIKWVLGAQSAKGLRGQEMADVIFKGSGSGNRPPMNAAEASLVFDNSDGRLPIDAPEVHVTRRVYRSGEGEYVINGNPCRLRDLRDMYSGTGLGSGAYSIIEQGKVDTLLQASPKDRRAILEEAAGISRFKAKKLEAQRRLERVDQNLLRLSDIVEEVDGRLRSVRAQASKARRYQEYTARLQELRTQVAQVDWRQLTTRLEAADEAVRQLQAEAELADRQTREKEAAVQQLETRSEQITQSLAQVQSQIGQIREINAVTQSTVSHGRRQGEELLAEAGRHRLQAAVLQSRIGDARQQLSETVVAFDRAESEYRELEQRVAGLERDLAELTDEARRLRSQTETSREDRVQQMRQAAALGSQILACRSQLEQAGQAEVRCRERQEEISRHCQDQAKLCEALRVAERELDQKTQAAREQLHTQREGLDRSRVALAARQQELVEVQGRRSGAAERASVIEELEERLEGVSLGVKEALRRAREEPEGPFGEIRGLVADALQVQVEHAGMVEVALGEAAHHLVVAGYRLLMHLQTGQARLPGRVGFVPLTVAVPRLSADQIDLTGRPGVIGRADHFVQCAAEFNLLVRRLVGRTWFVQTLAHAVALSQAEGRGLRFVTAAGELLEPDGTLVVGHGARASGIISRRSELIAVRELVRQLDQQIAQTRQELELQQR